MVNTSRSFVPMATTTISPVLMPQRVFRTTPLAKVLRISAFWMAMAVRTAEAAWSSLG